MYLNDYYTVAANLAGLPALNLPFSQAANGLPIGVQLTAKPLAEASLLSIASHLERLAAFDRDQLIYR